MARSSNSISSAAEAERPWHRAARFEDVIHAWRERFGRWRGLRPAIIPFVGYGSTEWVRVLCRVQLVRPGRAPRQPLGNVRGWRSFIGVHIANAPVRVVAGGTVHEVRADRGGVVDLRVDDIGLSPGWHEISISVENSEPAIAPVFIVDPRVKFGLVSDIDDTVMVTALPRPFLAAWNTFVLNEHARRPVPGMAVLYERLMRTHPGAPVVYLSTGAWNVAPALSRFLERNLYPQGALLLTDWGPTQDRWFRSGKEHKRQSLERLAAEFPGVRWLLVGDDGQHDPELYGEFVRKHAGNVAAVAIRQLSPSEAVLAGGRNTAKPEGTDAVEWFYSPDGAGLSEQLSAAAILPVNGFPRYKSQ
jgi:phosphatidate phosphatase APP1